MFRYLGHLPGGPVAKILFCQCRGPGSPPRQGARSHKPQLKILQAETKIQHSPTSNCFFKKSFHVFGCQRPVSHLRPFFFSSSKHVKRPFPWLKGGGYLIMPLPSLPFPQMQPKPSINWFSCLHLVLGERENFHSERVPCHFWWSVYGFLND